MATSQRAREAAARMRWNVDDCVAAVPWEKLRRKISVPAAINVSSTRSSSLAGPTVAMIFVRRMYNPVIMGQIVPDAIEHYLASLNRAGDSVLQDIARSGEQRRLPLVDAEVGVLLRVLTL